jgi:hypothetical protein
VALDYQLQLRVPLQYLRDPAYQFVRARQQRSRIELKIHRRQTPGGDHILHGLQFQLGAALFLQFDMVLRRGAGGQRQRDRQKQRQ